MASLRQWCSWGPLVPFAIAGILCIAFCFNVICNPSFQKSGFTTILFDFTKIASQGVALPVPTDPGTITGPVLTTATQVQSGESAAATAASSVASEAQSAVSSAVTAIETAADSMNCTLGVKYFCIGFTDDCKDLPLKVSNIIPTSVTAVGPSNFQALDQALAAVNSRSITGGLTLGLCFAILAIFPDVISICSVLAYHLGLISSFRMPEILAPFRAVCTAICCIPLFGLVIILFLLKAVDMPKGVTIETGEASSQVVAASICAIFMGISITVGWLLDRQSRGIL